MSQITLPAMLRIEKYTFAYVLFTLRSFYLLYASIFYWDSVYANIRWPSSSGTHHTVRLRGCRIISIKIALLMQQLLCLYCEACRLYKHQSRILLFLMAYRKIECTTRSVFLWMYEERFTFFQCVISTCYRHDESIVTKYHNVTLSVSVLLSAVTTNFEAAKLALLSFRHIRFI